MSDIFLSYAHEDQERIKALVAALEAQGWSVFWDHRIPSGQTWRSYIGAALDRARCVLVAWSQHGIRSSWVVEEADEGKRRGILIPLLLDAVDPPLGFREIQAANLADWGPHHPSPMFDQLVEDIRAHLTREVAPAPAPPTGARPSPVPRARPHERDRRWAYAALGALILAGAVIAYLGLPLTTSGPDGVPVDRTQPRSVEPRELPSERHTRPPPVAEPARQEAWLVILGSFPNTDRAPAEERLQQVHAARLDARIIETEQFAGLRPGLLAVVIGPVDSREEAARIQEAARQVTGDAYVRPVRVR